MTLGTDGAGKSRLRTLHLVVVWVVVYLLVLSILVRAMDGEEDGLLLKARLLKATVDGLHAVSLRLGRLAIEAEKAYFSTMDMVRG